MAYTEPDFDLDPVDAIDPAGTAKAGAVSDPRFLIPLTLFLAALFVITLAWRAGSVDDVRLGSAPSQDDLVQRVFDAESRAGFNELAVRQEEGRIVLEGQAETASIAAAIGAVARSVEGVAEVDNRLIVVGGVIELPADQSASVQPSPAALTLEDDLASMGEIAFEVGSATPVAAANDTINAVAAAIIANPGAMIEVHGHTDSDGDAAANDRLSQDRAEAVAAALVARGVDATRLTAIGFGESQPIAPNITAEGRAENRRIAFVIVG